MSSIRDAFDKYYAVFLYGNSLQRKAMAVALITTDTCGSILMLVYIVCPWVALLAALIHEREHSAQMIPGFCLHLVQGILAAQILVVCIPLTGEPGIFRGTRKTLRSHVDGCLESFRIGFFNGIAASVWSWHLVFQIGVRYLPELHFLVLLFAIAGKVVGDRSPIVQSLVSLDSVVSLLLAAYLLLACWHKGIWSTRCANDSLKEIATDIEFTDGLKLDVYSTGEYPSRGLLLWVHGGGWVMGERGKPNALVQALIEQGWVVCCADYRPAHADTGIDVRHQVADIKCAATWIRDHQHEFGAADLKLSLGGISAGAHLAILACEDISPAAVVLSSGIFCVSPADFAERPTLLEVLRRHVIGSSDPLFWEKANPITVVSQSKGFPPTVVLHGTADSISPIGDSRVFCTAVRNYFGHNDKLVHFEIANGPHGWDYFRSGVARKYAALVDKFVSSYVNQA